MTTAAHSISKAAGFMGGGASDKARMASNRQSAETARHIKAIKAGCSVKRFGNFINFYQGDALVSVVDTTGSMEPMSFSSDVPAASFAAAAAEWLAWSAAKAAREGGKA